MVDSGLRAIDTRADIALCRAGKVVVGEGVDLYGAPEGWQKVAIDRNVPTDTGNGWTGGAHEHTPTAVDWA